MPPRDTAPFRVVAYPRHTFIKDVWKYDPGEHASFIAPTKGGKTTLAYQLLGVTATPDLPAVVMVMKPRDATVERFTRQHRYRIVHDWPPVRQPWREKPSGYVLWPRHSDDLDANDMEHPLVFQRAIRKTYLAKHGGILFADEVHSLQHEYGLTRDLERIWTKGRSMDTGLWGATQQPAFVSGMMYSQVEHLFLGYDPDERRQIRFGEIGGLDPKQIRTVVAALPRYQFLYIRREDRTMCVVLDK